VPGGLCAACFGGGLFAEEPEGLPFTRIGDYELLEEIGRGGMGLVYRARQISLGRPAAVKLILTGPLASAVERQRFVAEASAAAALELPGIVAVYEAGEEDGQPFFAMQLIEGESLSARLSKGPRLALREAAELLRRTALAIQHAHERGFLHRDLKPGNILLDSKGEPHVTDFGLARRVDDDSRLTLTGAVVGTPSYMAPEQTDTRRPPTTAVDVYSLGAILYEMLAGRPPFAEKSLPELFVAIREKEPASISAIRSEMDRDLDIICRKCLEKDPSRRYRTVQMLADDLQRWRNGEPITARAVGTAERVWRWCRRRPAVAGLAAAVVLLFFGGLSGIVWQWRRANKEAGTAVAALAKSEEALWQANVNEARALRISRARGQRTGSLAALAKAAAHRVTREMRHEAIAALALPDLGEPQYFPAMQEGAREVRFDARLERAAYFAQSKAFIQRVADGRVLDGYEAGGLRSIGTSPAFDYLWMLWGREDERMRSKATVWNLSARTKVLESDEVAWGHSFSADGRRLVMHRAGKIEIVETATGAVLESAACDLVPGVLSADPAFTQAVLTGDQVMELWSLAPLERRWAVPKGSPVYAPVDWHPWDGSCIGGQDRSLHYFLPQSRTARLLTTHDREGAHGIFHPQGAFAATMSWDGQFRFCSPALQNPLLQTSGFMPCNFNHDGTAAGVKNGDRPGICAVIAPDVWRCLPPRAGRGDHVTGLEFSPDGQWLAVVQRTALTVHDAATLRASPPLPLEDGMCVKFTGPRSLLVLEERKGLRTVTLRGTEAGAVLESTRALPVPAGRWGRFALSPDGRRAFLAGDESAVFDLETGAPCFRLEPVPMMTNPAWSPDGRWLATGYWNNTTSSGSHACVWSAADGSLVRKFAAGSCAPFFTPDSGRLVVSSTHGIVEYETGAWAERRRHPREASGLDHGGVACGPGADLMALMADESNVRLVRLSTGAELARLTPPFPDKIATFGLAMSTEGRWLACAANNTVRLWDLRLMRENLHAIGLDWE